MTPSFILCADWGKETRKRAVFVADTTGRGVRRVARHEWTFDALVVEARRLSSTGPVLIAMDAPFGVPSGYLDAVRRELSDAPRAFLDLLRATANWPRFFDPSQRPEDWDVRRPFFAVPPGARGLTSYLDAARQRGVPNLFRRIDTQTGAKPVFVKAGIPGSVGSSARDVWMALRPLLEQQRDFAVWPFEGDLHELLSTHSFVLGETYPRAAYATALTDGTPISRPRLKLTKTDARHRHAAIDQLLAQPWVRHHNIQFEGLEKARQNEDDFDACITAAALLRCVLEDLPLARPRDALAAVEGGILGSGSISLDLPESTFRLPTQAIAAVARALPGPRVTPTSNAPPAVPASVEYACPIPGCGTIFRGSRGGWDTHVGSLRRHPDWRPELSDPEQRRHQFRLEFSEFFRVLTGFAVVTAPNGLPR